MSKETNETMILALEHASDQITSHLDHAFELRPYKFLAKDKNRHLDAGRRIVEEFRQDRMRIAEYNAQVMIDNHEARLREVYPEFKPGEYEAHEIAIKSIKGEFID